jgi:hypothetical protein
MAEPYLYRELTFGMRRTVERLQIVAQIVAIDRAIGTKVACWTRVIVVVATGRSLKREEYAESLTFLLARTKLLRRLDMLHCETDVSVGMLGMLSHDSLRSLSARIPSQAPVATYIVSEMRRFTGLASLSVSLEVGGPLHQTDVFRSLKPWGFAHLRYFSWNMRSNGECANAPAQAQFIARLRFPQLRDVDFIMPVLGGTDSTAHHLATFFNAHPHLESTHLLMEEDATYIVLPHVQAATARIGHPPGDFAPLLSPTVREIKVLVEDKIEVVMNVIQSLCAALDHGDDNLERPVSCNVKRAEFLFCTTAPGSNVDFTYGSSGVVEAWGPALRSWTARLRALGVEVVGDAEYLLE